MDVGQAMEDLALIKRQLRKAQVFRGYRAWVAGSTGLLALMGSWAQTVLVPDPVGHLKSYMLLWLVVAIAASVVGLSPVFKQILWPDTESEHDKAVTLLYRLMPTFAAGAIVTVALYRGAPEHAGVLPGVWAAFLGMGLFACIPVLPRAIGWVGVWYLACAGVSLWVFRGENLFSPWAMAGAFGVGQMIAAVILHWTLEREESGFGFRGPGIG
jgi:hypothetical protein